MERALVRATPGVVHPAFRDGLGERRDIVDPAGNGILEQLCLKGDLGAVPSFEFALRERVSRLAGFRHPQFSRVRSVERLSGAESGLAVVSERVEGVRLSDLLRIAEERRLALDTPAAVCLIGQLVRGVAALHASAPEVAHGAIGPERLVVTPDGRLVIVEYVLGGALEQFRYPRERYWSELRVAVPSSAGVARLDQRADVTQVGIVALSLILGRPLRGDEYPARVADVLDSTRALTSKGGVEPLPPALRSWIARALQLDVRTGFGSAIDACAEFDKILDDSGACVASPASLDAFLGRYQSPEPQAAAQRPPTSVAAPTSRLAPAPATGTPARPPAPAPTISRLDHQPASPTAARERPVPASAMDATPPLGMAIPLLAPVRAMTPSRTTPGSAAAGAATLPLAIPAGSPTPPRGIPIAAAVTARTAPLQLQAMAESVAATAPTPPGPTPIPGHARRLALPPKPPAFEPSVAVAPSADAEEVRNWPKLAAISGVLVAVLLVVGFTGWALFRPAPIVVTDGTLAVTTSPSGAQAIIDGRPRGVTPIKLQLRAGDHRLELRSSGGSRSIRVTITAGMQVAQFIELPQASSAEEHVASQTEPLQHDVVPGSTLGSIKQTAVVERATGLSSVPVRGPEGAPVSGWIAVSSPLELQVFEGDRVLGTSRSDRIMVAAGRHDIDLVSELYGYRVTRTVQVASGKLLTIATEMPKGTVALNATPWAEVWIDGSRVGETPIGNYSLAIGAHEVVFRHPELGEQTLTAAVTLKEVVRLSVDMTRKETPQ